MATRLVVIERIEQHTPTTKIFRLVGRAGAPFRFVTGQYCLLSFDGKAENERPFTYTNCSLQNDYVELAIKQTGEVTDALHRCSVGQRLFLTEAQPSDLEFDPNRGQRVALVAGGSGITPCISILRHIGIQRLPHEAALFYSNASAADIIYRQQLDELAARHPTIRVVYTLTRPAPADWPYERGRINPQMIQQRLAHPTDWHWYVCGPQAFNSAMTEALITLHVPMAQVHLGEG